MRPPMFEQVVTLVVVQPQLERMLTLSRYLLILSQLGLCVLSFLNHFAPDSAVAVPGECAAPPPCPGVVRVAQLKHLVSLPPILLPEQVEKLLSTAEDGWKESAWAVSCSELGRA